MSSPTPDSRPPRTTGSGRPKGGEPLSKAEDWDYQYRKPGIKGRRCGSVLVTSSTVRVREYTYTKRGKVYTGKREYVRVRCVRCASEKWVMRDNLFRGLAKGCRSCFQPKRFPTWLWQRLEGARQRCQNPNADKYADYGGRGIEFRFPSVSEACVWVIRTFGLPDRKLEIDRANNDGHYEPGNIRLSTRRQNSLHTRKSPRTARAYKFRVLYPHVTYADSTLRTLLATMTPEEVLTRWKSTRRRCGNRRSGTCETPDPFIVSQFKEF